VDRRLEDPRLFDFWRLREDEPVELIIKKAKYGDRQAAEQVVRALRARLEKMAGYYAVICKEDEGDLLQEAWLGVLEGLKDVDLSIGTPRQYLIERAKWRILDYVKYSRRRRHESLSETESCDGEPSVELEAVGSAVSDALEKRLTPVQKAVLRTLMQGYTWREVGERLGCSSANVAYHVRKIKNEYLRLAEEASGV